MPNRFANGVRAIAMCDRCGQQFKLKNLKTEIIKQRKYELLVCPECWDPDQPQLMLGTFPVEDPQALRNPRRDNTYLTAGTNGLQDNLDGFAGYPTGGSRDIQWGWNPVGGSSFYDAVMTPNNLVATTYVGTVTPGDPPGAYLTGVSAAGYAGNLLGPLPITGNSTTVEQGVLGTAYQPDPQPITTVSSTASVGSVGQSLIMKLSCPGQGIAFNYAYNGYEFDINYPTTLANWLLTYTPYGNGYTSEYMFADVGGTSIGLGYWGTFSLHFGYISAFIANPLPSSWPGIGAYTINNFALATQFSNIRGPVANQYASYSESGGQATFTWTGDNAIIMRDTYASCPALPVGTEIIGSVFIKDTFTWISSNITLGTLLSISYSSGTFALTYTKVTSFVPLHNPVQNGDMYFQTNGITFLPLVINV